jgi:hypothetical protein
MRSRRRPPLHATSGAAARRPDRHPRGSLGATPRSSSPLIPNGTSSHPRNPRRGGRRPPRPPSHGTFRRRRTHRGPRRPGSRRRSSAWAPRAFQHRRHPRTGLRRSRAPRRRRCRRSSRPRRPHRGCPAHPDGRRGPPARSPCSRSRRRRSPGAPRRPEPRERGSRQRGRGRGARCAALSRRGGTFCGLGRPGAAGDATRFRSLEASVPGVLSMTRALRQ